MKYLLTILFIFCFGEIFAQNIVPRSNGSQTPLDSNLFTGKSFRVPIFPDTTTANTYRTLDSAGKLIFTRNTNWFWGRQTSPSRKWVPFENTSNGLNNTCGASRSTGIVTWDSLLTFDVSGGPYVICCDGIPRAINNTSITLDTNSTDFQRLDLIILDTNGVNWVKGTPALNPSTPSTDSCQIILSYVLINAHDSVPAVISDNNPLTIHDENYSTEWVAYDSLTSNVTIDTANTTLPVHLLHSIHVTGYSNATNHYDLVTTDAIDLNNYAVLKFYVRVTDNVPIRLFLSWYLDGVQQTMVAQANILGVTGYQVFTIPTTSFRVIGTTQVNTLRINSTQTTSSAGYYIDWIQLQAGFPIVNTTVSNGTVTSVGMGNLDSLLIPSTANPNTTAFTTFTKFQVPAYRALVNNSNSTNQYVWGQLDLSTSLFTGLLPVAELAPGADGTYVGTDGGVVQHIPFENDTTFITNGLTRLPDPLSNNDTLILGGTLDRNTTITGANHYLAISGGRFEEGAGTNTAAANNLTLPSDGNVITITGNTQINAITTANWQAGSQVELIFTGTPTVKNNTAGGAGTATILLAGSVDFTAAANDVLSLVYDGTNWHESARKTSSSQAIGANNGLSLSGTNVQLGGVITQNTQIAFNFNEFLCLGCDNDGLYVKNLGGTAALWANTALYFSTTPYVGFDVPPLWNNASSQNDSLLTVNWTNGLVGRKSILSIDRQGADVLSANNLAIGGDGNSFEVTGATQINLISTTNRFNGAIIRLQFTSTPTVKNGQATSGSNVTILLAGGVDFSATSDDVLTLMLGEIGGTQAWREVSRSVN